MAVAKKKVAKKKVAKKKVAKKPAPKKAESKPKETGPKANEKIFARQKATLEFLKANPQSSRRMIAEGLKIEGPLKKANFGLTGLIKDGYVDTLKIEDVRGKAFKITEAGEAYLKTL